MARGTSGKQVTAILAVETNFAIGVIWEQRPLLLRIKRLCEKTDTILVIPEIALVEAKSSLMKRIDKQLEAIQQFRFWLNDIARAAGMKEHVLQIKHALSNMEAELQRRKQLILEAVSIFAQACTIAPLTPQVWIKAYLRWQAKIPPFKELDCLVMESLLGFLQRRKAKLTMFLNLDREDFDHPEVHGEFQRRKTLLLFEPSDVIKEFRKFYGVA